MSFWKYQKLPLCHYTRTIVNEESSKFQLKTINDLKNVISCFMKKSNQESIFHPGNSSIPRSTFCKCFCDENNKVIVLMKTLAKFSLESHQQFLLLFRALSFVCEKSKEIWETFLKSNLLNWFLENPFSI